MTPETRARLEQEIEQMLDWMKRACFCVEFPKGGLGGVVPYSDAIHALLFVRKVLRSSLEPPQAPEPSFATCATCGAVLPCFAHPDAEPPATWCYTPKDDECKRS